MQKSPTGNRAFLFFGAELVALAEMEHPTLDVKILPLLSHKCKSTPKRV